MAARIISVTFETTTQSRSGAFTVPRRAADLLAIGADDAVELRVVWEGGKLELATDLRSGWEVYPRSGDRTTDGLSAVPASTPITVTVWRRGAAASDEEDESSPWTDDRFDEAFARAGGPPDLLRELRDWAKDREIVMRYGKGKTVGPLHFHVPTRDPPIALISVGANAVIEWVFRDNLDRSGGFKAKGTRAEFFRRIGDLFHTDRAEGSADTWFGVPARKLAPQDYGNFLRLLDEALDLVANRPSELRQQYHRFFTAVLERFQELRPGVTKTQAVGIDNWLEFSAGRTGIRFAWSMAQGRYVRAELYIDVGRQAENKRIFDMLREQGHELERKVGQPITWERLDDRRASRIAVYGPTPGNSFDTDDELADWAAKTMAELVDLLRPMVESL